MKATKGISPRWAVLCLSQPPLHTWEKQPALGRSVSANTQGFCRNPSSRLLHPDPSPRVPCASTGQPDPPGYSILKTRQLEVFEVPRLFTTKNKILGITETVAFQLSSRFDSKMWGLACFLKAMGEKKLRGKTSIRVGKASWSAVFRCNKEGFYPSC